MQVEPWLRDLNSFLEDTAIIVAFAFLLVRGRALKLFEKRLPMPWLLGLVVGLAGCSEALFPGERSPYRMYAVVLGFAALECEALAAAIALVLVCSVVLVSHRFTDPILVTCEALTVVAVTFGLNWSARNLPRTLRFLVVPLAAQVAGAIPLTSIWDRFGGRTPIVSSILANYIGVLLLVLVLEDARARKETETLRIQAVEQRALSEVAELKILRAKLNPHFLFNALNAVASLCLIDGKRANRAVTRLSKLMRRVVDQDVERPIPVAQELEYVEAYLGIQGERYGDRLSWEIEVETPTVLIPALSIQTLVENAVLHGITKRPNGGSLKVMARKLRHGAIIAVSDDGVGIESPSKDSTDNHGLNILNQQLMLKYGRRSRLRILSSLGVGTLVAFRIPDPELQ